MNTKRGAVSNNIGELNTTKYRTSLIINSKTPKIMKSFLFIIFIITNTISAQIVTFNGQILDLITKEPIEYAHVSFKDFGSFGTSTNENGGFTLIVEQKYLDSKVFISCLGYEDRLVNTSELQNKSFYLKPKTEVLQEVIIRRSEAKEISLGSTKGKKLGILKKRNITMFAQFIKNNSADKCCEYLKDVTITFKEKFHSPAKARIRILTKDKIKGTPKNDLLTKSLIITVIEKQKTYHIDLSEFDIEVPEDGFFIAIEKIIIPMNMTFIAPMETSTYPKYFASNTGHLKRKDKKMKRFQYISLDPLVMSFEKYKSEVSHYAPAINVTKKKLKHKDFGHLYLLNANKWEIYRNIKNDTNFIMPIEVVLSN